MFRVGVRVNFWVRIKVRVEVSFWLKVRTWALFKVSVRVGLKVRNRPSC